MARRGHITDHGVGENRIEVGAKLRGADMTMDIHHLDMGITIGDDSVGDTDAVSHREIF
jgi:hypothetical protein